MKKILKQFKKTEACYYMALISLVTACSTGKTGLVYVALGCVVYGNIILLISDFLDKE